MHNNNQNEEEPGAGCTVDLKAQDHMTLVLEGINLKPIYKEEARNINKFLFFHNYPLNKIVVMRECESKKIMQNLKSGINISMIFSLEKSKILQNLLVSSIKTLIIF